MAKKLKIVDDNALTRGYSDFSGKTSRDKKVVQRIPVDEQEAPVLANVSEGSADVVDFVNTSRMAEDRDVVHPLARKFVLKNNPPVALRVRTIGSTYPATGIARDGRTYKLSSFQADEIAGKRKKMDAAAELINAPRREQIAQEQQQYDLNRPPVVRSRDNVSSQIEPFVPRPKAPVIGHQTSIDPKNGTVYIRPTVVIKSPNGEDVHTPSGEPKVFNLGEQITAINHDKSKSLSPKTVYYEVNKDENSGIHSLRQVAEPGFRPSADHPMEPTYTAMAKHGRELFSKYGKGGSQKSRDRIAQRESGGIQLGNNIVTHWVRDSLNGALYTSGIKAEDFNETLRKNPEAIKDVFKTHFDSLEADNQRNRDYKEAVKQGVVPGLLGKKPKGMKFPSEPYSR